VSANRPCPLGAQPGLRYRIDTGDDRVYGAGSSSETVSVQIAMADLVASGSNQTEPANDSKGNTDFAQPMTKSRCEGRHENQRPHVSEICPATPVDDPGGMLLDLMYRALELHSSQ
jgi:hypothetical protein